MNSVTATYHGFQQLPKGVKMMLVESENFFFHEGHTQAQPTAPALTTVPQPAPRSPLPVPGAPLPFTAGPTFVTPSGPRSAPDCR